MRVFRTEIVMVTPGLVRPIKVLGRAGLQRMKMGVEEINAAAASTAASSG